MKSLSIKSLTLSLDCAPTAEQNNPKMTMTNAIFNLMETDVKIYIKNNIISTKPSNLSGFFHC